VLLFLHGNERDLAPYAVAAELRSAGADRIGGIDFLNSALDRRLVVVDGHLEAVEHVEDDAQGLRDRSLDVETRIACLEHADQVAVLPASARPGIKTPGARDLL